MAGVTRLGDACTGHGAFPPRPNVAASGDVIVNGIGAVRKGDAWDTHCVPKSCHGGAAASGSGTVKVNGKDLVRIGDPIDCGSSVAAGSSDVIAGG